MPYKNWIVLLVLLFGISDPGFAQQQFPVDTSTTALDRLRPETYLTLTGEATITNYGLALSFPVFWIENRVKMAPLAGFFWKDFAEDGFAFNPALGANFLYYFRKQRLNRPHTNSFYSGLGGVGTTNDFFGSSDTERSRAGLRLGYDYAFKNIALAPELYLDINDDGNFYPGLGVIVHFGN